MFLLSGDNELLESLCELDSDGLYMPEEDLAGGEPCLIAVDVSALDRLGVVTDQVPSVKTPGVDLLTRKGSNSI